MSDDYIYSVNTDPMDHMEYMHLSFLAATIANRENPNYEGRLIDIMTDEHVRQALREDYANVEGFREDMIPEMFKLYQEADAVDKSIRSLCDDIVANIFKGNRF